MDIDTIRFSHILEADTLERMEYFLSHTAFIVSHKSESIETLQGVLWYLPTSSPIIIVTNCPREELGDLRRGLKEQMTSHKKLYLVHQKDRRVARLLRARGVSQILDIDGRVRDGKGEGMYIGTLCAAMLGDPRWVIFYDADNTVPCSLLEYTLAMGKLFLSASAQDLLWGDTTGDALHNVRICWASKPEVKNGTLEFKLLGRCTSVISPLFSSLLAEWFGIHNYPIISSNAGEQGMTMKTAKTLRFSSHYSIETFQFLDFLSHAGSVHRSRKAILQQYQSKSPHFHTKGDDEHIRRMIAQSLGSFFVFHEYIPTSTQEQLLRICDEMQLEVCYPVIYPSIDDLNLEEEDEPVYAAPFNDVDEQGEASAIDEVDEMPEGVESSPYPAFSKRTFVDQYKLFREYTPQVLPA
jgi:mannosyl-3-phosphoglycerate synthase